MMGVMADHLDARVQVGAGIHEFSSWMASEQRRIFLLCRRLLQDPEEADSATQDVFLKAYKVWSQGDAAGLEHPGKWVTRIAVNTCLDRLRSRAWKIWKMRPSAKDEELILERTPGAGPDAEAQFYAKQIQQRLEAALSRLSARQKAVFALRHYDGMALDDIAGVLGLDTGTVKAHLFRALGKLREELKDLYTARV